MPRIENKSRKNECKRNALRAIEKHFSGVLLMSFATRASSQALVLASLLLAGCAADGSTNFFTTGALGTPQQTAAAPESKVDPVCVTLVSRIEALRKEGVAEKIEKAATKKYTLTKADLKKADQLTKANTEFQQRCSTVTPAQAAAMLPPPDAAPPLAAPAAKAKTATKASAATAQ